MAWKLGRYAAAYQGYCVSWKAAVALSVYVVATFECTDESVMDAIAELPLP